MDSDFKLTPDDLAKLRNEDKGLVTLTRFEPCLCGTLLDVVAHQRKWHSGRWAGEKQLAPGINYTDLLCGDCTKEFQNYPRIVCLGCKSLMGFYKFGKQSTGFVFEKGRHYHIAECPRCNPKSVSTSVIEHENFCKANGVTTTTNRDLLQEIEIKGLQGKEAAAKLRAEFESSAQK